MSLSGKENVFPFLSYLRLHQGGISSFHKQVMTSSAQGQGEEEPSPEPRPSPSPHPQNLQVGLGIEKTLCGRSIFKLMTEPWSRTHILWFCSELREVTIRLWRNPRQCP